MNSETLVDNIEHQVQNISITFSPNPFYDKVNFDFSNIKFKEIIFSIYKIQGKKVFSSTVKHQKGGNNSLSWNACDFNNNQVEAGTYIAFVQMDGKLYKSIKLIKN